MSIKSKLTGIDTDVARSGIGDRSKTSRISTSQIRSVRKTIVLAGRVEVSLQLLRSSDKSAHAIIETEGDGIRVGIILDPDRTIGSVTAWVVSDSGGSLRRRGSSEVFGFFHLIISLCLMMYYLVSLT
jgi:hypothetical protein